MGRADTVAGLTQFHGRGAGTDAERRAARWLSDELETAGRGSRLEPFWCRPNWALAQLWHVLLGLAGSLVSVSSPRVGGALVLVALLSVIADAVTGHSPGRLLTPERASQNVVSESSTAERRVRLIISANYDAGRAGLAYRDALRRPFARLNARGFGPGWVAWVVIALGWLLATAVARLGGSGGAGVGALQLPPTVGLVLALALLAELATSGYGPAANDNASGIAVALALVKALDAGPPLNVAPELVLTGAGDGDGIGLRRHLKARKRQLNASNAVVIGIAPSGAGDIKWWLSDGALIPQRYFGRLRQLCAQLAADEPHLNATAVRGRGATPAQPARARGLPAIAIGCADGDGLAPRSHQLADTADRVTPEALDATVQFGLMLVDAIDSYIARLPRPDATPERNLRPA